MGIRKKANNMTVKVKGEHNSHVGGKSEKVANKMNVESTDADLSLASNKKITAEGNKPGDAVPTPPDEQKETYINGHFYNIDGTFEGKVDDPANTGKVDDVYTCTGKEKKTNADGKEVEVFKDTKILQENGANITHSDFCYVAYVVKAEAGNSDLKELKCIAYTSFNHAKAEKKSWKNLLSTSYSSVPSKNKLKETNNDPKSKLTRQALFYVLNGEEDITKGAEFWDGTDFLAWGNSETNPYNKVGQNKFDEYKFIEIPKDVYDAYLAANGSSVTYKDKGNHKKEDDQGTHTHVTKSIPKKVKEPVIDKQGNPVLDKKGNPTYKDAKGKNGKPVYEQAVDADGKPVVDKKGNPVFQQEEIPNKIKYDLPEAVFKDSNNWSTGNFYYETGVKKTNGISGTINAGKSIFWKLTPTRLTK